MYLPYFFREMPMVNLVRDQAGGHRPASDPVPRRIHDTAVIEPRFTRYCFLENNKYG